MVTNDLFIIGAELLTIVPMTIIRAATGRDAEACAAIYAPYVTDTAISFEDEPPTTAEMAERIAAAADRHAWLVAVDDERVLGYAYGAPFQSRPAYRFSCLVSVYLEWGRRRTGLGRALYAALLAELAGRGHRVAVAVITLPNEASAGLHRSMGFEPVGTLRRIGWKFGTWHDVAYSRLALGCGDAPEGEPS
jgi:phosphinothricin acetyltransferase